MWSSPYHYLKLKLKITILCDNNANFNKLKTKATIYEAWVKPINPDYNYVYDKQLIADS